MPKKKIYCPNCGWEGRGTALKMLYHGRCPYCGSKLQDP